MKPDKIVRSLVRVRFLVTLVDHETFDGLLVDADPTMLVLADAQVVASNGDRLAVDGLLYLPRSRVAYLQRAQPN